MCLGDLEKKSQGKKIETALNRARKGGDRTLTKGGMGQLEMGRDGVRH